MPKQKKYTELINFPQDWLQLINNKSLGKCCLLLKGNKDFIFAWGVDNEISFAKNCFDAEKFQAFHTDFGDTYRFGYLSYDIKNQTTKHLKANKEFTDTKDAYFFTANHVIIRTKNSTLYFGDKDEADLKDLFLPARTVNNDQSHKNVILTPTESKEEYISKIDAIRNRIQQGYIYEMNYCMNFKGGYDALEPGELFARLHEKSAAPFSSFFRLGEETILSTSPERFVKKEGDMLTSQPIKGTAKRAADFDLDEQIKFELAQDIKERAENIMIVDLVRNDLSRIAVKNSVSVSELCKVYSFKTVHQLISTIQAKVDTNIQLIDILEALFPMGSMTGAPKISAMQHIHDYENFDRGIYSGAIGYFEPNGNFDLNVVIRTLLINEKDKTLSSSVGGAITIKSDPEREYEECLLKLKAIKETLS
jgi:para-aminobenzoate synthetase component 1